MPLTRRFRLAAATTTAALALASSAAWSAAPLSAEPGPPPVTVVSAEPASLTKPNAVLVERIAPPAKGGVERWRLNEDITVENDAETSVELFAVNVTYPGSGIGAVGVDIFASIPAGNRWILQVPEERLLPYPLPKTVRVDMFFEGYDTPVTVSRALADEENAVISGSYRLPFATEDLPPGTVLSTGQDHDPGDNHRGSETQRFAFDLLVRRWNGSAWTTLKENGHPLDNNGHLIFGLPVRAMADGVIIGCVRSVLENNIPDPGVAGGNMFWIRHAPNEYALYAHLQTGSVSEELCPIEGTGFGGEWNIAAPIEVRAGDVLGLAGNTGASSGPHLHVHVQTADRTFVPGPAKAEGIPMRFASFDTHGWPAYDPETSGDEWHRVSHKHGSGLNDALMDPNPCGYVGRYRPVVADGEWVSRDIPSECYQLVFAEAVAHGFRPVFVDGYTVDRKNFFNAVFRTSDGTAWSAFHHMSGAQYQEIYDERKAKGYRLLQVDSYPLGSGAGYAAIFAKTGGSPPAAYHGVTQATHNANFASFTAQGFRPVNVSVVSIGGQRRYTALYRKVDVGSYELRSILTEAEFEAKHTQHESEGRRLVHVSTYEHDGGVWYSGIWQAKAAAADQTDHALTRGQFDKRYATAATAGRKTIAVAGVDVNGPSAGGARFAAVWRPAGHPGRVTVAPG